MNSNFSYGADQHEALDQVAISLPSRGRSDDMHLRSLEHYPEEAQEIILDRLDFLQALGKYIAKDFAVPVLLNEPGEGWHWNFVENVIRIDPEDLLHQPLDYLRFVIAHEGAHRRITRFDLIEDTFLQQPGYGFMSNAIEDPRVNNFLIASYERLQHCADAVYGVGERAKDEATQNAQRQLGFTPQFMLAGFEYISQWYRKLANMSTDIDTTLPQDVIEVIQSTVDAAHESWSHYPTQEELESRPALSSEYQQASHDINRERIWPEFKKLVESDIQKQEVQEFLQGIEDQFFREDELLDETLMEAAKEALTEEEYQDLMDRLAQKQLSKPIPLHELSEEIQEKLRKAISELDASYGSDLREKAKEALKAFEGSLTDDLQEMLDQITLDDATGDMYGAGGGMPAGFPFFGIPPHSTEEAASPPPSITADEFSEEIVRAPQVDKRRYDELRTEHHRESQALERDLRRVFRDRKKNRQDANFHSGRGINISKRIKEVATDIHPLKSKAWERKAAPLERDYAITLVIDQTGSMHGNRITEALKALVMIAEPLSKLGVQFEILGFNSRLNVYKEFKESFTDQTRARISGAAAEAHGQHASNTDDGWALHVASKRLESVNAKQKFIIVCTDGQSNPSAPHAHPFFDLDEVLSRIELASSQEVIGVGIGSHTNVPTHYAKGVSGIAVEELATHLSRILQEIIEHGR